MLPGSLSRESEEQNLVAMGTNWNPSGNQGNQKTAGRTGSYSSIPPPLTTSFNGSLPPSFVSTRKVTSKNNLFGPQTGPSLRQSREGNLSFVCIFNNFSSVAIYVSDIPESNRIIRIWKMNIHKFFKLMSSLSSDYHSLEENCNAGIDLRRQNLTSKVDPGTVRVKIF